MAAVFGKRNAKPPGRYSTGADQSALEGEDPDIDSMVKDEPVDGDDFDWLPNVPPAGRRPTPPPGAWSITA